MQENRQEFASIWPRAAELAARYRAELDSRKQRPEQSYAESLASFEEALPEQGQSGLEVIEELDRLATPGIHATTGSRFFGWVIGGSHEVGVAADWLTSCWGQNAANHTAAPAAAATEAVAARWLLEILELPREASVGFVTGCTMANFVCLAAARGEVLRRAGWDCEQDGIFGAPPIRVILGEDAHSTVYSALMYLGLGQSRVHAVATDAEGAMLPAAFAAALAEAAPDEPVIAITQAGQINTGAFDPLTEIIETARRHANCWVHVDGAFGLWARACPSRERLCVGAEGADSWATDGHKWLQAPYDGGFAIVRDPEAHRRAMTISASYLPAFSEGERDPSQFVPELSRRARGFSTWALFKHFGRKGISELVDRNCRMASRIAERLRVEEGVEVLNEVCLNQVAVRFGEDDELTRQTILHLQEDGACFAGGAKWKGVWIMRVSVIGYWTGEEDADRAAEAMVAAWRKVRSR
jgi:glutamate/tyrosine decarboxylase-like PLP-dependent enzyme